MSQQVRVRPQSQVIQYVSNGLQTVDIGRGMIYRELYLRLQGQITATAANNIAANTQRGDEWGIVKQIVLKANGNDEIKRISGEDLRWMQYFNYGAFPVKDLAQIGDGATANPSFDSTLILPLWMPRSIKPMDMALDSRLLSDLQVQIQWGADWTSINSAATAWTTPPNISIMSLESFNISGPFSRWNVFPVTIVASAANPKQQQKLPTGPMYRNFMFKDESHIITNMKLLSGTTVYADIPQQVLNSVFMQSRRGLDINSVYASNTQWLANSAEKPADWEMYDHVTDGYNTEAIDTLGLSEFIVELAVSGAGTVTLYPGQIIPVRAATPGASAKGAPVRSS